MCDVGGAPHRGFVSRWVQQRLGAAGQKRDGGGGHRRSHGHAGVQEGECAAIDGRRDQLCRPTLARYATRLREGGGRFARWCRAMRTHRAVVLEDLHDDLDGRARVRGYQHRRFDGAQYQLLQHLFLGPCHGRQRAVPSRGDAVSGRESGGARGPRSRPAPAVPVAGYTTTSMYARSTRSFRSFTSAGPYTAHSTAVCPVAARNQAREQRSARCG